MNSRELIHQQEQLKSKVEEQRRCILFKSSFLALSEKELELKLGKIILCGDFPEFGYPVQKLDTEAETLKDEIKVEGKISSQTL
jgi:hypothetical protein